MTVAVQRLVLILSEAEEAKLREKVKVTSVNHVTLLNIEDVEWPTYDAAASVNSPEQAGDQDHDLTGDNVENVAPGDECGEMFGGSSLSRLSD